MNDSSLSILAIGAHPDDIEFGCGGVIARETLARAKAHFVICSRGESGTHGSPEERTREAEVGAARLGATLEFVEFGGDAHLQASLANALTLAGIIRRVRPRMLLAPTPAENQHPDHVQVAHLARNAARLARYGGVAELKEWTAHSIQHLLYYAITPEAEPTHGHSPVLFDVSEPTVFGAWVEAMEAHASQLATRRYVDLQVARARVRGLQAGVGHAIALWPNDPLVFPSLAHLNRSARQF